MQRRVEALTVLVADLLAEVEALRAVQIAQPAYRAAYREVSLLTHDSSGIQPAFEKLLDRYYPSEPSEDGRTWRELLMMRRLGFTPAEIEVYQADAERVELDT